MALIDIGPLVERMDRMVKHIAEVHGLLREIRDLLTERQEAAQPLTDGTLTARAAARAARVGGAL